MNGSQEMFVRRALKLTAEDILGVSGTEMDLGRVQAPRFTLMWPLVLQQGNPEMSKVELDEGQTSLTLSYYTAKTLPKAYKVRQRLADHFLPFPVPAHPRNTFSMLHFPVAYLRDLPREHGGAVQGHMGVQEGQEAGRALSSQVPVSCFGGGRQRGRFCSPALHV